MDIKIGATGTGVVQGARINAAQHQQKPEQQKAERQNKAEMADRPDKSYNAVSSQGDTLELSEDGRKMSSEMQNLQENTAGADGDGKVIAKSGEKYVSEAEDSVSTIDLSSYTETELKQMYLEGDITKAEYEDELDDRNTKVE